MSDQALSVGTMAGGVDRDRLVRARLAEQLDRSYNLARLLTGDRLLAEDATHDAVVRALRAARTLRDLDAFDAWFRRILVNSCRDALRRGRARAVPEVGHSAAVIPDPAPQLAERDAMGQAISTLSVEHREVIVLRFYTDLPVEAIAVALGIRVGTTKSRLHRALAQLRAAYDAADRPPRERPR